MKTFEGVTGISSAFDSGDKEIGYILKYVPFFVLENAYSLLRHPFVAVVQVPSRIWLFATPWTAACQASLSFTVSQSLVRLTSIELVMPSNHHILCCPLLLMTSIFPNISVLSSETALLIRDPEYLSFSFSSVPPMIIQGWFPLGLTGLISLQSKGHSRIFSNTTVQKHQFFGLKIQ